MALIKLVIILGISVGASSSKVADKCDDATGQTCLINVDEADSVDTSALLQGRADLQAGQSQLKLLNEGEQLDESIKRKSDPEMVKKLEEDESMLKRIEAMLRKLVDGGKKEGGGEEKAEGDKTENTTGGEGGNETE